MTTRAWMLACVTACACGGAKAPATVTVEALPARAAPSEVETQTVLAQPAPSSANADRAPEVLAPGQVTIVHFFASWCAPCAKSLPELDKLHAARPARLAVVAIGEDDDESDMRAFVSHAGVSYTVLWDAAKAKAQRWRVATMPTTYVVDKHGATRFTHAGYHDGEGATLDAETRALIAEP